MVVVRVSGELDCATAPDLERILLQGLQEGPPAVLVDLRGVTFVDPAGAHPLRTAALAAASAGCEVRLRAAGRVRLVLDLLGLGALFES